MKPIKIKDTSTRWTKGFEMLWKDVKIPDGYTVKKIRGFPFSATVTNGKTKWIRLYVYPEKVK